MAYIQYDIIEAQDKAFNEFLKQTRSSVSTMVNTFERKKNAFNTKAATRKKTGALDMRRVANYRTSENIFAKKMVMPNQKNHKVMIMIDWSGSMSSIFAPIIYQAINVAQFCKKAGINFQVMAFTDGAMMRDRADNGKLKVTQNDIDMKNDHLLMEFLSDKMSIKEFNEGCKNLFTLSDRAIRETNFSPFGLNGTPLNQGLVTIRELISEERSKFDSYSLVVLTDGESAKIDSEAFYNSPLNRNYDFPNYVDAKNNKMYNGKEVAEDETGYATATGETSFLMGLIKEMQVKNFVFHFFSHRADTTYTNKAKSNTDRKVYLLGDKHIKNLNEFFYVNANAMFTLPDEAQLMSDDEEDDTDWGDMDDDVDYEGAFNKIDKNATVNSIQKEFAKVLSSEKIKRIVGVSLVNEICSAYN